jgi:hypothetical protein
MFKPAFLTNRRAAETPGPLDRVARGSSLPGRASCSPAMLQALARACAMGLVMPPYELWIGRDRESRR